MQNGDSGDGEHPAPGGSATSNTDKLKCVYECMHAMVCVQVPLPLPASVTAVLPNRALLQLSVLTHKHTHSTPSYRSNKSANSHAEWHLL